MSAIFKIDMSDIKELEADLKTFARRALPFATKETLNQSAFAAQTTARRDIETSMTLRNKFTKQSVRVEQARTLNINNQSAHVGSTADYMEQQEFGGINTKKGKQGIPIPTAYAVGQGESARPRTKLPRGGNKLQNIQLSRKRKRTPKNRKQAMIFTVQDAVTTGKRMVFLNLGRTQGIFRIKGGRKKFKRGWPKGAELKMMYDLTRDTTRTPPNPWLKPAFDYTVIGIPERYRKALIFQLKRNNLFKDK